YEGLVSFERWYVVSSLARQGRTRMLCRIDISRQALVANFEAFKGLVGHERLAPVLKSNAYGHGIEFVYCVLEASRPAWLCVNYVVEAELLRGLGFQGRILVVGPAMPSAFPKAQQCDAELTLGNFTLLEAWLSSGQGIKIHLKVDSGLSRQGFFPEQMPEVLDKI